MTASADDPLRTSNVNIHIAHTHLACVAAFEHYTGINLVRWRVLSVLHAQGESTQKELAELTGLDGWSITRAVKPLQEEGLVERSMDPADNRLTRVGMTERGHAAYALLRERRARFLEVALKGIEPAAIEQLEGVLMQIQQNLKNFSVSSSRETEPLASQHS